MRKVVCAAEDLTQYSARNVSISTLIDGGSFRVTLATFGPGGRIGSHPTGVDQLFHVVSGGGWASGDGGERIDVTAGEYVLWQAGEDHESGSDDGMTVVIVQAAELDALM